MNKVPKSFLFFIFTAFVFLLQLFPLTGVFLMIFAAPFWSVITINLGFIFMAWEALSGKLPRWCIVFPVLYVFVYLCFAVMSHLQLAEKQGEVEANNQSIHIPFDPSKNSLVIAGSDSDVNSMANKLVELYDVPVVYEENSNFHGANHTSFRISSDNGICGKFGLGQGNRLVSGFFENGAFAKNLCLVQEPEDPTLPVVKVMAKTVSQTQGPETITITDANGQIYNLEGGFATGDSAPLKWLPMPVMGCALNDAGPNWKCFADFLKDDFTPLVKNSGGMDSDSILVADALGLKKVTRLNGQKPSIVKNFSFLFSIYYVIILIFIAYRFKRRRKK